MVLPEEPVLTRDTQLALWTLYELSYRGFDDVTTTRVSAIGVAS